MLALLIKEINSFFNTITGYFVIIIFLVINGLFLWVFPGELNILDSGYATLNTFFFIAPWVFLFLVPAITMRMFADEKKTGTIELLITRPLTTIQLILAKYLAAIILVLFSLIPSLIFFVSVYLLGSPVGNIDIGGTWGSYIGLFFLAGIYAAIGIFSSSLTDNQVIAFLLAVLICFLIYTGFDSIGSLGVFQYISTTIAYLGINEHYKSLSRGIIDSRDIVYFLSAIFLFLLLTHNKLKKLN